MAQVYRWALGYWQTIRAHTGTSASSGCRMAVQATETMLSVVSLICMVPVMLLTAYTDTLAHTYGNPVVAGHMVLGTLNYSGIILLGFFGPDLLLTVYAVISIATARTAAASPALPLHAVHRLIYHHPVHLGGVPHPLHRLVDQSSTPRHRLSQHI